MNNNHVCLVCLGSNVDGIFHLKNAHAALMQFFYKVEMGNQITTPAEGDVIQPDYINQAARFVTDLAPHDVILLLKQIEKDNGRKAEDKLRGRVPLDIDLLMYDEEVLKPLDMNKTYVQRAIQSLLF